VGFIRHLPHKLVEAFKATLEETVEADLLVHVVDCATDERDDNMSQVDAVLKEIAADEKPQLLVFNKIDLIGGVEPRIDYENGVPVRVWLSAKNKQGCELFAQALSELIAPEVYRGNIILSPQLGALTGQLRAKLFSWHAIEKESYDESGNLFLQLRLKESQRQQMIKNFDLSWQDLEN
jgi:GTP-binding protein HflX